MVGSVGREAWQGHEKGSFALGKPWWPADKVERWMITRLRVSGQNPRSHPEAQVEQIAASIRHWGFTVPILVEEDGTILAGSGRYLAAKRLSLVEVPVIVVRGWSDEQKTAYRIADNKIGENSKWDDPLLELEVGELVAADFDIDLLGLSSVERKKLAGGDDDDGGAGNVVHEVATSEVYDEFWIAVRGPLKHQADALVALRTAMQPLDGVTVELGTINFDS
jgi:hypothetical protein